MWNNKGLLIILCVFFALSLSAQNYGRRFRRRNTPTAVRQTNQPSQNADKEKSGKSGNSGKSAKTAKSGQSAEKNLFDPAKPSISVAYVNKILTELRTQLLEKKISNKLPGLSPQEIQEILRATPEQQKAKEEELKKEIFTTVSQIDYRIFTTRYRSLIKHFELEEVTGIQRVWYNNFLAEMDNFEPIIQRMYLGNRHNSREEYRIAAKEFEQHQKKCLDFMTTSKNFKLSRDQIAKLKMRNAKIRQQNYL